ncbi:hypothetical protein ABTY96_45375 [Streptomyces sp. NPDC096057]|uniref:hypothetical protein n=1 Tax=Streptomyces sp. NPDC096057 TaxID=3155543 RepID=UPI003330B84A
MSPRTPRSTAEPIATSGGAHAERRIRRAAALPMPDGVSMSPLAPADPLGAGHDESTLRSLFSVLAASRTAQSEPEADPAAWRPSGTDEAGQSAAAIGAEGVAAPTSAPQRRSGGGRLTSKVTERPFLVAAAVAGAVVASTPFLVSGAKDHTTTYEGLGKADPVAVEGGGLADRHPDAYPSQLPVQGSVAGGATTSADNLLDPDAGSWHGAGGDAAAGDTQTVADSPLVPGVLAADTSGSGAGAHAPAAHTSGQSVVAADPQDTPAKEPAAASRPSATTARATGTTGAETPAKTTPAKATVVAAAKPSAATTAVSSDAAPVAARVAAAAPTGTDTATGTKPTAAGSALTPVEDDSTSAGGTDDPSTTPSGAAQAVSSSSTEDTPTTDTSASDTPATDTSASDTSADTPAGQNAAEAAAPTQWGTKVFTSTFTLRSGESVHSDRMRITMRADGDLVISDENGTVRWSSHTSGQNNLATFKADGELVVRSAYQQTLWSSQTGGHTGAKLVIQNDGNVTILSAADQTLWAADTQH